MLVSKKVTLGNRGLRGLVLGTLLICCHAGCSPTRVEFTGAVQKEIAEALWHVGNSTSRYELFGSESVRVWPSVEDINKPEAVFRYTIRHFLSETHGVDTVGFETVEPNKVVISLKCEEKNVNLLNFFSLFNPYERDVPKERRVIQHAVWRLLKKDKGLAVKGLSGWQPAALASVVNRGESCWIGFRGFSLAAVEEYLESNGYVRAEGDKPDRRLYRKELTKAPRRTGGQNDLFSSRKSTWHSKELVIAKVTPAPTEEAPDSDIISLGIAAKGEHRVQETRILLADLDYQEDVAGWLREFFIDKFTLHAAVHADHLKFEDPARYAEDIACE